MVWYSIVEMACRGRGLWGCFEDDYVDDNEIE